MYTIFIFSEIICILVYSKPTVTTTKKKKENGLSCIDFDVLTIRQMLSQAKNNENLV